MIVSLHDCTYLLCTDQLSLSNIGLPDVRLCYAVNLPILRKATSLPKPKQFVVHYKLCGSIDERINNLSVTESCVDLQGWPGGCCYEVRLFLTLDIDGFEISLNTTTVHQGYITRCLTYSICNSTACKMWYSVLFRSSSTSDITCCNSCSDDHNWMPLVCCMGQTKQVHVIFVCLGPYVTLPLQLSEFLCPCFALSLLCKHFLLQDIQIHPPAPFLLASRTLEK